MTSKEFLFLDVNLNYQRTHADTTRAVKGIYAEFIRLTELRIIFDYYLSNNLRIDSHNLDLINKLNFRLCLYSLVNFKLFNPYLFLKSIFNIGFNFSFYYTTCVSLIITKIQWKRKK